MFGVYFVFLIKFIIFPFTIFNNLLDAGNYVITDYINIIPFNQLMGASTADWLQVFGNLVLLLPLGIYISVMKPGIALGRMVCIGLLISILIESVQLFLDIIFIYPNHFMDITDIIFNVSGFILGYLISRTALVKNIYPIDKLD
ncbi:VanZ family protein [Listeria cornellensis]|uniref:VanZ family protein n=1 Tax=Listeria cornellensis TaxID=1494961 RepID=UPI000563A8C1|nr:VanZ family protein [Listeria cornellensis]